MTNKLPRSRAHRATYDKIAPNYENAVRPLDRWFLGRLRESTLRYLPDDARVLEIGAGTGLNFVFYPMNCWGVATEPSREMLRIAGKKRRPENVRLVQSSAEHLPFQDNSFDAAFATLVFCSLTSPDQPFSEIRRVLKPAGMLLLLEHVRPDGLLGPIFDLLNLITVPLFNDHFNRRTAMAACAAGLEVVKIEKSMLGIINLIVCRT